MLVACACVCVCGMCVHAKLAAAVLPCQALSRHEQRPQDHAELVIRKLRLHLREACPHPGIWLR